MLQEFLSRLCRNLEGCECNNSCAHEVGYSCNWRGNQVIDNIVCVITGSELQERNLQPG